MQFGQFDEAAFLPYDSGRTDDQGNPIMVDAISGEIIPPGVYGAAAAGVAADTSVTQAQFQDQAPGANTSYVVSPGQPIALRVETAPDTLTLADAANAAVTAGRVVVDSAGKYYKYVQTTNPNSGVTYLQRQATAAPGTINPLMIAAIAGIALLALS